MKLQELIQMVWDNVDDAPSNQTVVRQFQAAQNRLASAVEAKFPSFFTNGNFDANTEPVFDDKWHEALALFACAKYKEAESSISEANNFMAQFEELKKEFVENYQVPQQYRDDRLSQQFTVVDGQSTFTITKLGYDPSYGNLKVYVKGIQTTDYTTPADGSPSFTVNPATPLVAGDMITTLWEEHYEYQEPPYSWWNF